MRNEPFQFKHEGRTLHGIVDRPDTGSPLATIVLVHGHGKTNVAAGDEYVDLRRTFCGIGLACCA